MTESQEQENSIVDQMVEAAKPKAPVKRDILRFPGEKREDGLVEIKATDLDKIKYINLIGNKIFLIDIKDVPSPVVFDSEELAASTYEALLRTWSSGTN